jgi:hypothetical protein
MKQLTFVPCFRDMAWVRGFNWGFEAFRTLILDQHEFNSATAEADFLPVLVEVGEEMAAVRTELLPRCSRELHSRELSTRS